MITFNRRNTGKCLFYLCLVMKYSLQSFDRIKFTQMDFYTQVKCFSILLYKGNTETVLDMQEIIHFKKIKARFTWKVWKDMYQNVIPCYSLDWRDSNDCHFLILIWIVIFFEIKYEFLFFLIIKIFIFSIYR